MKYIHREHLIATEHRNRIISFTIASFSLLYLIAYTFIFWKLNILPMFNFNLISVIVFSLLTFLVIKFNLVISTFLITGIELIIFQFLAEYYLGSATFFHVLLLIMSIIPFFIFGKKLLLSLITAVIPAALFIINVAGFIHFEGIIRISPKIIKYIYDSNIIITCFIILTSVLLFAFMVSYMEENLRAQVEIQSEKLQKKNNEIIKMQHDAIISLSNLVEDRDGDTGEHVQRTADYVSLLAQIAKDEGIYTEIITNDYISLLHRAAPLHDIGKIVVSDTILKKTGKLTPEEFDEMKKHVKEGRRIILDVLGSSNDKEYVRIASEIASYHHERWDGNGYPYNLFEKEIPLSARIMSIADVFDALVSPRCYKKPFSLETAFGIIKDSAGTQFDPVLAKLFVENRALVEDIFYKYQDD